MPFAMSQTEGWQTLEETIEQSSLSNKSTLLVFSGSDWCKPCIQFKKEILESQAFNSFAENHLDLYIADFPYRKQNKLPKQQEEYNEALAEKYNKGGLFPHIILLDERGKTIKQIQFSKQTTPDSFIAELQ